MIAKLKPGMRGIMLLLTLMSATLGWSFDDPPRPVAPVPSPKQLAWQDDNFGLFIIFGMNTFTGSTAGSGDEDPKLFAPSALDCRQWVSVAKAAGIKSIIFTPKYLDGFCLWPTATTGRSVKSSGWRGGKGDVVRELADACKAAGIKLGFAVTSRDKSQPSYSSSKAEYYQFLCEQLKELLTNYGPIHEIWFDDTEANGREYSDLHKVISQVRQLQPEAIIKQATSRRDMRIYEDVQWVGNTQGLASSTCWSVFPRPNITYKLAPDIARPIWFPIEARVAMGKNYWSNEELKTPTQLLDRYYKSVGRNSNLLICVAPDTSGRITRAASDCLVQLGAALKKIFGKDLAAGKPVTASNVRQGSSVFSPEMALDNDANTYWATDDGITEASLEVKLLGEKEFNVIRLEEMISLGQRVQEYTVEAYDTTAAQWVTVSQGTTIGYRKLDRFPKVKASKVRLTITKAKACPAIKSLGVHLDAISDAADFEPANALVEFPPPAPAKSGKK